ncbi:MAG: hypothetical protein GY748_23245 [Planctomycetaceae bacterium]|nr:hypothetical protein [Planctomycetaceae bacterium]
MNRQDRVYRVLVFIEAVGQATVDQRMNEAIPILTLFGAEYLNDLGIVADDNIDHVRMPITDTGIISLPFGDIEYIGFEMRITITEKS